MTEDQSGGSNQQQKEQSITTAQADMSTVSWQNNGAQKVMHKSRKMNTQRRVDYQVDGVGQVTEEWTISLLSNDDRSQEVAMHSVYVEGQLARQINLKTGQVLKQEPKYEPYAFLRYGTNGSTESTDPQGAVEKVPIMGVITKEGEPKQTGSSAQ